MHPDKLNLGYNELQRFLKEQDKTGYQHHSAYGFAPNPYDGGIGGLTDDNTDHAIVIHGHLA